MYTRLSGRSLHRCLFFLKDVKSPEPTSAVMYGKKVWHPGRSIAASHAQDTADGCEEGGRGWSGAAPESKEQTKARRPPRVKIPRRDTATVVVKDRRPATVAGNYAKYTGTVGEKRESRETQGSSYNTIEQRSCNGGASLLECGSLPPDHQSQLRSDFCGWTEREVLSKYALDKMSSGSNSHAATSVDRSSLQTPGAGCRSNQPSRAGSRYSSGRRKHYDFRHLEAAHDYIDHYRRFYCYSTLSVPPPPPYCNPIAESGEGQEEEEENPKNFMPLGVKSLYRGDPYLRELVSRLGVRNSLQNREQKLLKSPRPTPPSIVRKSKEVADLAVCAHGKSEEAVNGTSYSSEKTSQESSEVNSPKPSRPLTLSVHPSEASPLELPTIPQTPSIPQRVRHHKDNSNSVISVAKYLRVSSHTQPNSELLGDLGRTDKESVHSLVEELSAGESSTLTLEVLSELLDSEESVDAHHLEDIRKARFSLPDQLPLLDECQKEKLISQKAHALGLLSRGWAKAPQVRRMMGRYIRENSQEGSDRPYSRPVTCGGTKKTSTNEQTPSNAAKDKRPSVSGEDRKEHRNKSSRSRSVDNSKLEKLKTIYNPSEKISLHDKKREIGPSRLQSSRSHRCESRMRSRPTTRLGTHSNDRMTTDRVGRGCYSRPVTRLGRKTSDSQAPDKEERWLPTATVKEMDTEDECYWNELPTNTLSRPATRHRHIQSSSYEAKLMDSSRPVTRNGASSHLGRRQSAALTVRLRKSHQRWEVPNLQTSGGCSEGVQPGASPNQITAHAERVKRKFKGLLEIQQHKLVPA